MIELSDEAIELALLGREAVRGRPGGLILERAMHALVTAALLRHHPIATEQVANGGPMRQLPMRMTLVYQSEQLLATPRRMALARLQQRLRHVFGRAMGRTMRSSRTLLETRRSLPQIAFYPLISGFT